MAEQPLDLNDVKAWAPDGKPAHVVLAYLEACASAWDPKARVLGNLRAEDLLRALGELRLTAQLLEEARPHLRHLVDRVAEQVVVGRHDPVVTIGPVAATAFLRLAAGRRS